MKSGCKCLYLIGIVLSQLAANPIGWQLFSSLTNKLVLLDFLDFESFAVAYSLT